MTEYFKHILGAFSLVRGQEDVSPEPCQVLP